MPEAKPQHGFAYQWPDNVKMYKLLFSLLASDLREQRSIMLTMSYALGSGMFRDYPICPFVDPDSL